MKLVFTWIDQNAISIDVALIVDWFVRLATIVECDRVGPNILFPLADLLAIVLPVHTMPVKIVIDVVFEAGPDGGAWIGGGCVDDDRSGSRTAAIVDPVFATTLPFLVSACDVVTERACVPDVDRSVQILNIVLGNECGESLAGTGIRVQVLRKFTDVVVLGATGFVR